MYPSYHHHTQLKWYRLRVVGYSILITIAQICRCRLPPKHINQACCRRPIPTIPPTSTDRESMEATSHHQMLTNSLPTIQRASIKTRPRPYLLFLPALPPIPTRAIHPLIHSRGLSARLCSRAILMWATRVSTTHRYNNHFRRATIPSMVFPRRPSFLPDKAIAIVRNHSHNRKLHRCHRSGEARPLSLPASASLSH